MPPVDWESLFMPTISLFEIVMRGTLVYLAIFVFLRIMRRGAGTIGIADLLVVVLIADAAQNAMGSKYQSITEGVILIATILFWNYSIDYLSYKFPRFRKLAVPAPISLIENGQLLRRNLQREMITRDEVMSQLREQGVEDLADVKSCYLEGDGQISVIKKGKSKQSSRKSKGPVP